MTSQARFSLIAKTFFGLEEVLAEELRELGAENIDPGRRMVSFKADQRLMYRVTLCSRVAVRILKPIHAFTVRRSGDPARALYKGAQKIDWSPLLDPDGSLAIDPVVNGALFKNSLYAAQVVKDAIVDQFKEGCGRRPSVDLTKPDLRINLHIADDRVTIYLDASGDSLHKRGYRASGHEAPLNETLAAGLLRMSGWDGASPMADLMCGSGTLAIEAAMAARNIPPGAVRKRFGFTSWKDFDLPLWNEVLIKEKRRQLPRLDFPIQASDIDPTAVAMARENARRAGVENDIHFQVGPFDAIEPAAPSGMLVLNPPYDERMQVDEISALYGSLGDTLKRRWAGWSAAIMTGAPEGAKSIGLRTSAKIKLFNGPIECRLLKLKLFAGSAKDVSS